MSGLFLNFYQIEIDLKEVSVKALNYSDYQSKEDFLKIKNIELEFITHTPNIDQVNNNYDVSCDENGNISSVRKSTWKLYEYTYNLVLFEERYNVLSFIGGNCGMLYAR